MNYLVFPDQASAEAAIAQINMNAGYPNTTTKTVTWAVASQTLQGSWVFLCPSEDLLAGVVGGTQESYSQSWFPTPSVEVV